MTTILDFYSRKGQSPHGGFHDVLDQGDIFWEACHGHQGVRV